jgi:hypothetical protein
MDLAIAILLIGAAILFVRMFFQLRAIIYRKRIDRS